MKFFADLFGTMREKKIDQIRRQYYNKIARNQCLYSSRCIFMKYDLISRFIFKVHIYEILYMIF